MDTKSAAAERPATAHPSHPRKPRGRGRVTIIEENRQCMTEGAKAAWWRRNVVKLAPDMLSQLTGYSERAIYDFEHGVTRKGKPHKPKALLRYRMCCAAVDGMCRTLKTFKWGI